MRKWHDESLAIDHLLITGSQNAIAICFHKLHICSAGLLCQPDVAHGGKFKLTQYYFSAFAEIQRAGNAVDAR